MKSIRIALCQLNSTVGDIEANSDLIIKKIADLKSLKPDIIAFPELAVCGYPPEDLLYKKSFIADNICAVQKIAAVTTEPIIVVGFIDGEDLLYNAAAIMHKRRIIDIYHKMRLPNYGVFDEKRYFTAGSRCPVYSIGDIRFGINICEDIWHEDGPASVQAESGAEVIVNINASPYHRGKSDERITMLAQRASKNRVAIAYVNTVGGQDELVFDGHSLIMDHEGNVLAEGCRFREEDIMFDIQLPDRKPFVNLPSATAIPVEISTRRDADGKPAISVRKHLPIEPLADIYHALVTGTRDYLLKNGFRTACLGLSGGIDSSFVAVIATAAIGKDNVRGIFMPSSFTSEESRSDATALAQNLGIAFKEIPISPMMESYISSLKAEFMGREPDITEENLQARIRGNILMALSNKFGSIVLTTGNKSEMSVGYATLYGDMAGGFAPIKDVPKTLVFELCHWLNRGGEIIPQNVLQKEPTAELKPGQKDSDSLPPYDILDPILKAYIEDDMAYEHIVMLGFEAETVRKVIRLVDSSEYKRRQSPPGIKITPRAFGRDRRFPITNRYRSC